MTIILVLDTETTGFANYPKEVLEYFTSLSKGSVVSKAKKDPIYLKYKSKILQLSYIVYDLDHPKKAKIYDKYILPEKSLVDKISLGASEVHGITEESLKSKQKNMFTTIEDAIDELKRDVESCDVFVGHNIGYDISRIEEEVRRTSTVFSVTNSLYEEFIKAIKSKKYDTMTQTKVACGIPGKKKGSIKNPSLAEAYEHFFNDKANEKALHNALVDIIVCLRVYVKHVYGRDICGENKVITRWIEDLSSIPDFKCDTGSRASDSKRSSRDSLDKPISVNIKQKPVKTPGLFSCIGSLCSTRKKTLAMGGRKTRKRNNLTYVKT
jgi:DNA polymerase III epsilon subunit-like protein